MKTFLLLGLSLRSWNNVLVYVWLLLKLMFKGALRSVLCIQLICIFQQYRYNLNNQFINICTKIYNVDKHYKDLVSHIFYWQYVGEGLLLMIQKCASSNLQHEMQSLTFIIYEVWSLNISNIRTLISLTSCSIYNIIILLLSTAFCSRHWRIHTKCIINVEESTYKALQNKQHVWYKKLCKPETDNLSKNIR